MKNLILWGLFVTASAAASPSAKRLHHEFWQDARARVSSLQVQAYQDNPYNISQPLNKIDFSKVSNLSSQQNLSQIFEYIRDTRFILNQKSPIQNRRLSWLYPDDGCYIRADLMADFIKQRNFPSVMKIFAFGNLAVQTRNTSDGMVRWWYHVAPVYRVHQTVYVLDPAIEPTRALTIQEWKSRMSQEDNVDEFALCHEQTFDPDDSCGNPRGKSFDSAVSAQKSFHGLEWLRLQELGRDPYKEL